MEDRKLALPYLGGLPASDIASTKEKMVAALSSLTEFVSDTFLRDGFLAGAILVVNDYDVKIVPINDDNKDASAAAAAAASAEINAILIATVSEIWYAQQDPDTKEDPLMDSVRIRDRIDRKEGIIVTVDSRYIRTSAIVPISRTEEGGSETVSLGSPIVMSGGKSESSYSRFTDLAFGGNSTVH